MGAPHTARMLTLVLIASTSATKLPDGQASILMNGARLSASCTHAPAIKHIEGPRKCYGVALTATQVLRARPAFNDAYTVLTCQTTRPASSVAISTVDPVGAVQTGVALKALQQRRCCVVDLC